MATKKEEIIEAAKKTAKKVAVKAAKKAVETAEVVVEKGRQESERGCYTGYHSGDG